MYITWFVVVLLAVIGSAAWAGRRAAGSWKNGAEPLLLVAGAALLATSPATGPFAPGGGLGLGFALGAVGWYLSTWTLRAGARQEGSAYCVAPALVVLVAAMHRPDPLFVFAGATLGWLSGVGPAIAAAQSEPRGPGLGRSPMPLLQGAAVLLVACMARENASTLIAVATLGVMPYAMHAAQEAGWWASVVLAGVAAAVAGIALNMPLHWFVAAGVGLVAGAVCIRAVGCTGSSESPFPGAALAPGVIAVFAAMALARREGGAVAQLACLMPLLGLLSVSVRRPLALIGGSTAGLAGFGVTLVLLTVVRRRLFIGSQLDVQHTASDLALFTGVLLPMATWALPALRDSALGAVWRVVLLWGSVLLAGAALILLFHADGMALLMMGASVACVVGLLSGRDAAAPLPTAFWVVALGAVIALWAGRADDALDTWEVSRRSATYVLAALGTLAWFVATRFRGQSHAG